MSTALNDATAKLTASLSDAESAIIQLNAGVCASVPLFPPSSDESLHFGKLHGRWGLFILQMDVHGNESQTPLKSASRYHRVAASQRLAALLEEIKRVAFRVQQEVEDAATAADAFSKALKQR